MAAPYVVRVIDIVFGEETEAPETAEQAEAD